MAPLPSGTISGPLDLPSPSSHSLPLSRLMLDLIASAEC
ncbi:hypothetical protein SynRS9915_00999 [Synechococcus sp. RS9915]|nr:hypothetical protein SynRS9915_00999 [Synechococcus sp. RS9915]